MSLKIIAPEFTARGGVTNQGDGVLHQTDPGLAKLFLSAGTGIIYDDTLKEKRGVARG
jgi:hypothetical protein